MKIKAQWGFRGDALKLNAESADVKAGQVFEDVDPEYGHVLVGKGLVVKIPEGTAPRETKPAKPAELKAGEGSDVVPTINSAGATDAAGTQTAGGAGPADAVSDAAAGGLTTSDQGADDKKALLIQQLEAAGVEFDRRWGAARLEAALAEAQKKDPA
ncbi:hypothetical protein [Stenotrophomonas sp.]|uniref:hypothetical protein n=1 Tax=Stenotrophomonas sp. TaxID=69392 RepID=UPI0028A5F8C3|nr:hypothetical protein [Stenotrophomonas sp.]